MNAKSALYALCYGLLTAFTVYLASWSEQKWRPLPFSEFYLSAGEVATIAGVYGILTFVIIFVGRLFDKSEEPSRAFSLDYLNFLLAYTIAILYFLLASSITFNPNLYVYVGIYASAAALLLHLIFYRPNLKGIGSALLSVLKRFGSVYGVVVLILFVTPLALAIGFIFSRDVADVITEIRLQFNKATNVEYGLVPVFENTNFRRPMIARYDEKKQVLYVLERSGDMYQVDYPSGDNKKLILDIKDKVGIVDVENGALGFDLHPSFNEPSSPHYQSIFLYYTAFHDGKQQNIVSKFTFSSDLSGNEQPLMVLNRTPDAYHNGGSVDFGPDGYLYIALGEGVYVMPRRDNKEAIRAAIVRIDVDNKPTSQPIDQQPVDGKTQGYSIPTDNPFVNDDDVLDEYWVMGLRNPFRISFDPQTHQLWLGDVGSTVWEEVNKVTKGENYLYPYIEGPKTADFTVPKGLKGKPTHPYYTYKHSAFDRAVIGGVVYRGAEYPALTGLYLFGDNFSGKIFAIETDKVQVDSSILVAQAEQYAQRGISSITYSPEGEVFVTLLGAKGQDTGQLMRLTSFDQSQDYKAKVGATQVEEVISVADTKSLYLEMCARCHGNDGNGKGPDAKLFKDINIANFTSLEYQRDKSSIESIIKDGGPANGLSPYMPPWSAVLSEKEIAALADYIQSLNDDK